MSSLFLVECVSNRDKAKSGRKEWKRFIAHCELSFNNRKVKMKNSWDDFDDILFSPKLLDKKWNKKNFSNFYLFIAFFNSETSYNIKMSSNEQTKRNARLSFFSKRLQIVPTGSRFDHCSTHNYNGSFSLREVARGRANEWKQNRVGWGRTALKRSSI